MKNGIRHITATAIITAMIASSLLTACGSTSGTDGIADKLKSDVDSAVEQGKSDTQDNEELQDGKNEATDTEAAPTDTDTSDTTTEGENVWDGGPDFDSIADEFYGIFRNLTIEEAAEKYAINMVDGGKYADYEGDIGVIIPEYKDVDLNGDHKPDTIRREGKHYVVEFSDGKSFKTQDFSASPNEGEIIEFQDMACRNRDEILFAHYTFGTGGPVVWDTDIWSDAGGEWKAYNIIDKDGNINSKEMQEHIAKHTGKRYEANLAKVSAIDMTSILLNFGTKDGPLVTNEYEYAYLHKYFAPGSVNEREDFSYYESTSMTQLVYNWPLELAGEQVDLTADEQYKFNIFLSNFSEQNFRTGVYPAAYAHFALKWMELNDFEHLDKGGGYYRLDHSTMNKVLGRYFGYSLEESEFYSCGDDNAFGGFMDNGYYCESPSDGEMYANNAFSVVVDSEVIGEQYGDRFLKVWFAVYRLDTEEYDATGIGKTQYSLNPKQAQDLEARGELIRAYDGMAIIRELPDETWLEYYTVYEE